MTQSADYDAGAFREGECAPVPCSCDGHKFPGVSHIAPCCDEPHIEYVIPPGGDHA